MFVSSTEDPTIEFILYLGCHYPRSGTHKPMILMNSNANFVHNYLNNNKYLRSSRDDWLPIHFTDYLYPHVFHSRRHEEDPLS